MSGLRKPPDWAVAFGPEMPTLAHGDEVDVTVTVKPPDTFTGRQAINVNAFDDFGLAGGVTLYVEKA